MSNKLSKLVEFRQERPLNAPRNRLSECFWQVFRGLLHRAFYNHWNCHDELNNCRAEIRILSVFLIISPDLDWLAAVIQNFAQKVILELFSPRDHPTRPSAYPFAYQTGPTSPTGKHSELMSNMNSKRKKTFSRNQGFKLKSTMKFLSDSRCRAVSSAGFVDQNFGWSCRFSKLAYSMLQSIQKNRPLRNRTRLHPRDTHKTPPKLIVGLQKMASFLEKAKDFLIPLILMSPSFCLLNFSMNTCQLCT